MIPSFPLVGRTAELQLLRAALDRAAAGHGGLVILSGVAGTGKTRLAASAAEEAERRGFAVARGRAYPLESGVPYALFTDALLPLLRPLSAPSLKVLARGGLAELSAVFPTLVDATTARASAADDAGEVKGRVLWTMTQLVIGLAGRAPLLLALDDIHAADAASLELLHFLARQITDVPVLIVCTYNETERRAASELRQLEQSLLSLGVAAVQRVQPFDLEATTQLVSSAFGVAPAALGDFPQRLFDWTRGNAFFIQETLRTLIETGRLRREAERWLGWEQPSLEVPATVREAVVARMDRLSADARSVAEFAAALGTRADHELIAQLTELSAPRLLSAIDELRRGQVLVESSESGDVAYDFTHPMLRQALYAELGKARAKLLHVAIASALEKRYGDATMAHADELAYHYSRADNRANAPLTARYLGAAGASALRRYANREAVAYLVAALEQIDRIADSSPELTTARRRVLQDLARARQRLGEYERSLEAWHELLRAAQTPAEIAELRRGLALTCFWSGRYDEALEHVKAGIDAVMQVDDAALEARLRLALVSCLHELGRAEQAQTEAERAHALAARTNHPALLARTHRTLLLQHTWTGPPQTAREHGREAIHFATVAQDYTVLYSVQWSLALLEGLTGDSVTMASHIAEAERIADALHSPLLSLTTTQLQIEYLWAVGEWERGIEAGERAIALARSLNQQPLLTRLLVWTGLIYLGRGEIERGRAYMDEAWRISGADAAVASNAPVDVHQVVPAHIGRALYFMAIGDFRAAIGIGEQGLAIADRTGYVFWAIHRLLPIVAESYCHLGDIEGALRCEARLRRDSQRLDHTLGLAWADTCRAIVEWLRGNLKVAVTLLTDAAASLEAIPVVPDAARLRRQLAGRLADTGDREGALRELRRVHDIFAQLGATPELNKTRGQFRELNAKPPARTAGAGTENLTARELEIAQLVAARRSNKAIGKSLDISARTVSTHLSNIFKKLGVTSRAELTDYVRDL